MAPCILRFYFPSHLPTTKTVVVMINTMSFDASTQLTFTCLKSTIETLEKGVKYVQSLQ